MQSDGEAWQAWLNPSISCRSTLSECPLQNLKTGELLMDSSTEMSVPSIDINVRHSRCDNFGIFWKGEVATYGSNGDFRCASVRALSS